jgi:YfiH family protein
MIKALHSPFLKTPHAFFTRQGGVSTGIFKGLQCTKGKGDNELHVEENRKRCVDYMERRYAFHKKPALILAQQVHSNIALLVDKPFEETFPEADAYVTTHKNLLLSVFTADCCPILFHDEKNSVIGAAHAGWKGAFLGVIENTIDLMIENGAIEGNIKAVIGPCLHQQSFEVTSEFLNTLQDHSSFDTQPFIKNLNNKYYFDIISYVQTRLRNKSIKNIDVLPFNTYEEENLFFSYRRDKHNFSYGGQLSCIGL